MYCYAQLNSNKICVGISQLSKEIEAEGLIRITLPDYSLLGKKYDDGAWIDVPQPEPPLTEQEQILTDIYLNTEYLVALQELEI